jgi:hypothetical protein
MKFDKIIFPHPVLGLGRADDFNGSAEFTEPNIEILDEVYKISFSIIHDNGTIVDMVKNKKAIYCCEIFCSGTLYRDLKLNYEPEYLFEIKRADLRGSVEFNIYCIVNVNNVNYSNPAAHEDYSDFLFSLDKGDLLAYFGSFNFDADLQYQKLKAASSFMEIIPNEGNEQYTIYDIDASKIRIKLPIQTYEKFKTDSIGKKKEYTEIIHASLVQVALTTAMYNYKEKLGEGILWAQSVKYRLETEPELNNGTDVFDNDQVPSLVQKLLGNPNFRLVESLEKLSALNEIEEK